MDKKRTAFGGFLHGNQKADFAGENPAEYLAPGVSVCAFAPEKGFALSVQTEELSMGYAVPAGESMTEENYNDAAGFTEGITSAGSF